MTHDGSASIQIMLSLQTPLQFSTYDLLQRSLVGHEVQEMDVIHIVIAIRDHESRFQWTSIDINRKRCRLRSSKMGGFLIFRDQVRDREQLLDLPSRQCPHWWITKAWPIAAFQQCQGQTGTHKPRLSIQTSSCCNR